MTAVNSSKNEYPRDQRASFETEFRLALACARWPLRAQDGSEIRQLAGGPLDWNWFKRIVDRNQILPLVYTNLRDALGGSAHGEILGSLRDGALGHIGHSMSQAAQLVRVSESIRSAGLESLALKGVSLSALAYGNLAMRTTGDIDLLVAAPQVSEVERVLLSLGYTRLEPKAELTPRRMKHYLRYYKHFTYACDEGAPIELHWRLFHNIPLLKQADRQIPPSVPIKVGSGVVDTLSPNELFLYLAVHGAIHGWPILKWLADLGAMLSVMTNEDLAQIAELASERGLMAELRAALLLVDQFLGSTRPSVELPCERDQVVERIVEMGWRLLTAENYCLEIHRLPRMALFFYDLRLRSSWRYRSEDIRRSLVLPEDWELINLPDALFPLYTAVRPVSWLVRHFPRFLRREATTDST